MALATQTPPARIQLNDHIVAVYTGHSYAFVVTDRATQAVGLIDAGSDPQAHAIAKELEEQGFHLHDVSTVFLTHGHAAHTRGLEAMPQAKIRVTAEDAQLAFGQITPKKELLKARLRTVGRAQLSGPYEPLLAGERLHIGQHRLVCVALPGHTPGSVGFLVSGGLVIGDAAWVPKRISAPLSSGLPWIHEDATRARWTVKHLSLLAAESVVNTSDITEPCCRFVADGHTGEVRAFDIKDFKPKG